MKKTNDQPTLKIEKNIPIPPRKHSIGLTTAFREMNVGDSVLVPRTTLKTSLHGLAKPIGIKITTRIQADGSIRIWRVA